MYQPRKEIFRILYKFKKIVLIFLRHIIYVVPFQDKMLYNNFRLFLLRAFIIL